MDTTAIAPSEKPRREPPAPPAPSRMELSRRALLQGTTGVPVLLASVSVVALAGATALVPIFEPEPWDDGTFWGGGTSWVA